MARGPHTAHRLDLNHKRIVAVFKSRGLLVLSLTSLGGGAPDVLVACPFPSSARQHKRWTFVEIKSAKGTLRAGQQSFYDRGWPVVVVRTEAEAEALATELIGS